MTYRVVTQPAAEAFTIAQVRQHLRSDLQDVDDPLNDDAWITRAIRAARDHAEQHCNRPFLEQTLEVRADAWPCWYAYERLGRWLPGTEPAAPARGVVVTYLDENGAEQTLATSVYAVDTWPTPSRMRLAYGQSWPNVRSEPGAVATRYVAGFSLPGASPPGPYPLPAVVEQAMLLMIGHWYENREAVNVGQAGNEIPLGVLHMLAPYRLSLGV